MDVARPSQARQKQIRQIAIAAGSLVGLLLITLGLSRLRPAAPSVDKATARIETRLQVELQPGPAVTLTADPDQLEQLLINLVRNAADAASETGGGVRILWGLDRPARHLELCVEDDGPGLPQTANLFVPFFTTKPHGSGIGLVLSRQIAEAHGGSLSLENRASAPGCRATLRLPLQP